MGDTIEVSKCVDDVRAQHWVNVLNEKCTVTRIVCSQSVYVANDNFVVGIDICTRRSKKLVHATIIWLYKWRVRKLPWEGICFDSILMIKMARRWKINAIRLTYLRQGLIRQRRRTNKESRTKMSKCSSSFDIFHFSSLPVSIKQKNWNVSKRTIRSI